MTGLQIAAVGAVAILALVLAVINFDALKVICSATLWLIFSASVMLRSMAAVAGRPEIHPSELADDEVPNYTVVVALYRETSVVGDLIKAIDAFDYPKGKLDIKLVVEQRDVETLGSNCRIALAGPLRGHKWLRQASHRQRRERSISRCPARKRGPRRRLRRRGHPGS